MSDFVGMAPLKKTAFLSAFNLWVFANIYAFWAFCEHPNAGTDGEVSLLFFVRMLVLTFPIGFLVGYIVAGISAILTSWGYQNDIYENQLIVTWFLMFAAGAVQWFWLLPRLIKIFKNWCRRNEFGES